MLELMRSFCLDGDFLTLAKGEFRKFGGVLRRLNGLEGLLLLNRDLSGIVPNFSPSRPSIPISIVILRL
jgi:hypothetical protein